jgi:hypothetical protein
MAELAYILCAATSMFCAFMLFRSYRATRARLLFLSTLCFAGLAVNSILVILDLLVLPDYDLRIARAGVAYISVFALLLGLVWESR